jgi:hypothetical protein
MTVLRPVSAESHRIVTKTIILRTVPVESHGDDLPLSFYGTLPPLSS